MQKQTALIVAKPLFKAYPSVNKFFITEDEQAFETESMAQAHASSLSKPQKPSEVITVTREECESVASAKVTKGANSSEADKVDSAANDKVDDNTSADKVDSAANAKKVADKIEEKKEKTAAATTGKNGKGKGKEEKAGE